MSRSTLGRAGETMAADLYRSKGFLVLDRNVRYREGEIDLVCRRGGLIVFCEVKTRRVDTWGEPSEAVGPLKQSRLRRLAARWLTENAPGRVDVRFDVVSIVIDGRGTRVTWLADAF